jgi:hypothetical protein
VLPRIKGVGAVIDVIDRPYSNQAIHSHLL